MKSQGDLQSDSHRKGTIRPGSDGRRSKMAALIVVAVLAALLLWISQAIVAHNRLQNCLDSGRRDCVPVDSGKGS